MRSERAMLSHLRSDLLDACWQPDTNRYEKCWACTFTYLLTQLRFLEVMETSFNAGTERPQWNCLSQWWPLLLPSYVVYWP